MIHHLVYISQPIRPASLDELGGILSVARTRNVVDAITGLLIYCHDNPGPGAFVQLLEGDEARVEATYGRIERDRRHHRLSVVVRGPAEARLFPDWSMGLRNLEPAELVRFEGFADLGTPAFWTRVATAPPRGVLRLLRSFRATA